MRRCMCLLAVLMLSGTVWAVDARKNTCEATALKSVGSGPLLEMAVFGDSVLWGDGLRESPDATPGHKFSALIADWLAQQTGRSVERTVYAHSGASVVPTPSVPDKGLNFPGDVNSFYPTISDQLECVAPEKRAGVDLILLHGCINDMGAFEPVNPQNSKGRVDKLTQQFCGTPVEALLQQAAALYPHAVIVFTGYFPIISEKSDIAPFLDFLHLFFPDKLKHLSQPKDTARAKSKSAENSKVFYDRSNQLFKDAVDHVNHDRGDTRLHFLQIPFGPENAFGTHPSSYLWPIPTLISQDEVYLVRQTQCLDAFKLDLAGLAICDVDPTAHPNPQGAQAIALEIEKVLTPYVAGWKAKD